MKKLYLNKGKFAIVDNQLAKKYFGQYAKLNIIGGSE